MEAEILRTMRIVEDAGGMYRAVESGLVQRMIGESARRFQARVDAGEQTIVGVNRWSSPGRPCSCCPPPRATSPVPCCRSTAG